MEAFVIYLFRVPRMILLLSLAALACLPVTLYNLVRDLNLGLLLPPTLAGMLLAWSLAHWRVHRISAGIALLFTGPLLISMHIGQLVGPLFELVRQTFEFAGPLTDWLRFGIPCDPSGFVQASSNLSRGVLALGSRLSLWTAGLWQGGRVDDPMVRALVWSLVLWWIAVWAGWQVFEHKRLLAGMIPSTILLALIVDYTGEKTWILWLHLCLLLFLYGLSSYHCLQQRWDLARVDYADSTGIDTLFIVGALTLSLVTVSSVASIISIRDILDHLREKRAQSTETRTDSLGLPPASQEPAVTGSPGAADFYAVGPGPELSDRPVMTVSTGELPPMPASLQPFVRHYYWRSITYRTYTGRGWTNPPSFTEDISPDTWLIEPPYPGYRRIHQEVVFAAEISENLYWAGTLLRADAPFEAVWIRKSERDGLLESDLLAARTQVKANRLESVVPEVSERDLRNSPATYPEWVTDGFLTLPDSVPERVLSLGRRLSAPGNTPFDRAIAIQEYLRRFPYSLDVPGPPPRRDAVDYFLFELKRGYCDYYATAMVVLSRAAGLPARMVLGYASGVYDVEQARYFVTKKHAHAWVEIYFTGIGWIEFEPTANQPAIVYSEAGSSRLTGRSPALPGSSTTRWAGIFSTLTKHAWLPGSVCLLLALAWITWDSWRLSRLGPERAIQLLYRRFCRLARPVGRPRAKHQTAHAYAGLLIESIAALPDSSFLQDWLSPARDDINRLTELYARSLFAPAAPTRLDAFTARKAWSRLWPRLLIAGMFALVKPSRRFLSGSLAPRTRTRTPLDVILRQKT